MKSEDKKTCDRCGCIMLYSDKEKTIMYCPKCGLVEEVKKNAKQ